jgi:hypothetical protein
MRWAVVVAALGGVGQVAMAKLMAAFTFNGGGARGDGAVFDLSVMPKDSLLKSCAVIVIGLCFDCPHHSWLALEQI